MTEDKSEPPDLDRSVETLKILRKGIVQQSTPKTAAQLYVAAVGLLYHIKADRETLQKTWIEADQAQRAPRCPSRDKIPAISAVVHDADLYYALLRCLTNFAQAPSTEADAASHAVNGTRKRSLSISNSNDANKFLKTAHSPIPTGRKMVETTALSPTFSVAVLAASILYASFSHLDHWPASLVKAYADDTFGPREWVENANCKLLVQNLALCHKSTSSDSASEEEMTQAARVVEAYDEQRVIASTNGDARRGSTSSTSSRNGGNMSTKEMRKRKRSGDDGNSSSSGEDEEVVLSGADKAEGGSQARRGQYPLEQNALILEAVRQRYFGVNAKSARDQIALSLNERLDVKSKQNSGLLQSLPSFASIPPVRRLVAANLAKWLQSPALAGLARSLFSATVRHIENADPPLSDDLSVIESILSMRLKANQLNAHIGNVTAVAQKIPTSTVVRHIYSKLLRDEFDAIASPASMGSESSSFLKMVGAVHRAVPAEVSYEALASTFLIMMATVQPKDQSNSASSGLNAIDFKSRHLFNLRKMLRAVAAEFSHAFDGMRLLQAFFGMDIKSEKWSPRDEENKARLMFQCVTLAAAPYVKSSKSGELDEPERSKFCEALSRVRKLLLSWFCTDYGSHYSAKLRKRIDALRDKEIAGAGQPDFRSALDPSTDEKIPTWLNTLRCILFVEDPESDLMKHFVLPDVGSSSMEYEKEWETESKRIKLCSKYGGNITDDLLWIILKSSKEDGGGLEPEMSIQLFENLLESCGRKRRGSLTVNDPTLIWELYNLALFTPREETVKNEKVELDDLPRLAYPGVWWRATVVSLIFCGASGEIATVMWSEHPTLQSLMKMVTSSRYRFPTVDCDDESRETMRAAEQEARDEETRVAEDLFLPPPDNSKEGAKKTGARMSRRLLKQQKEREAAKVQAEKQKRKKMLKAAQKSIMLWDPDGPARKPPRYIADLIVAVNDVFGLSDTLQKSSQPDFLSMTIGNTTREAVERAYDWLIPVVSRFPSTIARLPSSTSCFLLLRAYGTDGEERKQLKQLAAPLLQHVKDSLAGKLGAKDCKKAFELLMTDVASPIPDRRRCARRVLSDSVPVPANGPTHASAWMVNILQLDFAKSIIPDAVKYLATAASHERGSVLKSLLIALERIIEFSGSENVEVDWGFPELVMDLISRRPSAFSEAIDSFSEVRTLAVKIIHDEFVHASANASEKQMSDCVQLTIFKPSNKDGSTIKVALALVRSVSVLLSVWKDDYRSVEKESSDYVDFLVDSILRPVTESLDTNLTSPKKATNGNSKQRSNLSVELWIMMAKARSDSIAKHAALAAPAAYLPRLLLCSGLPKSSLITMIDRLGKLGDQVGEKKEHVYLDLLVPSASSHWDIGRLGQRREVPRKLLGRVTSYLALHKVVIGEGHTEISPTFLEWLSEASVGNDEKRRKREKKVKKSLTPLATASNVLQLMEHKLFPDLESETLEEVQDEFGWLEAETGSDTSPDPVEQLESVLSSNEYGCLESIMSLLTKEEGEKITACEKLLRHVSTRTSNQSLAQRIALQWVPVLCVDRGRISLWVELFKVQPSASELFTNIALKCAGYWAPSHILNVVKWICTEASMTDDDIDVHRVCAFLVSTIAPAVDRRIASSMAMPTILREDHVEGLKNIVLSYLSSGAFRKEGGMSFIMVLADLLASRGKGDCKKLCSMMIAEHKGQPQSPLSTVLLQLYLKYPDWLDLSSVDTRTLLMKSSEEFAPEFAGWESSLDQELCELIDAIRFGHYRLVKTLADLARRHPLIVLRKGGYIASLLELDASNDGPKEDELRGIVHGRGLLAPREAKLNGGIVKVAVRHWGYSYTEPVWIAFLDAMTSPPKEVLFGCGLQIGLLKFLSVYLHLLSIQLQLLSTDKSKRLKSKLSDLFVIFQKQNPKAWRAWLGSKIDLGEIRHVLMGCDFISPQQAIESLKASDTQR